jgi:hypothetical protein
MLTLFTLNMAIKIYANFRMIIEFIKHLMGGKRE